MTPTEAAKKVQFKHLLKAAVWVKEATEGYKFKNKEGKEIVLFMAPMGGSLFYGYGNDNYRQAISAVDYLHSKCNLGDLGGIQNTLDTHFSKWGGYKFCLFGAAVHLAVPHMDCAKEILTAKIEMATGRREREFLKMLINAESTQAILNAFDRYEEEVMLFERLRKMPLYMMCKFFDMRQTMKGFYNASLQAGELVVRPKTGEWWILGHGEGSGRNAKEQILKRLEISEDMY